MARTRIAINYLPLTDLVLLLCRAAHEQLLAAGRSWLQACLFFNQNFTFGNTGSFARTQIYITETNYIGLSKFSV